MHTSQRKAPAEPMGVGYLTGLKQPVLVFEQLLRTPGHVDWVALDGWLKQVFLLDMDALARPAAAIGGSVVAQALGERVLLLGRVLLQMGRVPAFEAGRVLGMRSVVKKPGYFVLRLAVPCAGWLLRGATIKLHQQVAVLLQDWCDGKLASLEANAVCERLDSQVIKPLSGLVSAGRSTIHLLRAAYAQGMPFQYLGAGQYQIGWGSRARRILSSGVDTDSAIGVRTVQNKQASATVLRLAGLAAPDHVLVMTEDQAVLAARQLGWPVVVKPVDRDRGEGVTVGIEDEPSLRQAFKVALALSRQVLVERMVAGFCYRLLMVRGCMLYAVKRLPKSVVGDAQHTVKALVALANEAEQVKLWWERAKPYPEDELACKQLAQQGLDWDSVPAQGERAFLRPLQTDPWGGDIEDMTSQVHPDNVDLAVRAARLFGLDVTGIDLITTDISRPWHQTGAILNELNGSPLMGGGPLSRQTMPVYWRQLMPEGGRVPITVLVGDASVWRHAQALQVQAQGVRCYATSDDQTWDPQGKPLVVRGKSLLERSQALLLDADLEALVLVLSNDELVYRGFPVDVIDRLVVCNTRLMDYHHPQQFLPEDKVQRLLRVLETSVRPA